ncbi:site-specific integrase [Nonlabens sp. Asnod3-A02]|uniref:site-specific integrase n=1 Tax=Nonlabens sp. Asnod3-A02 TaxID=3160579 RepID=UPI00386E9368
MKKTEKLNYNSTMKFANTKLTNNQTNQTKRMTDKAFGLLVKVCLKTGIRASDLLNLNYDQFTENRTAPNTFTLEYFITKTNSKNVVPVGADLMRSIQVYKMECLEAYGTVNGKIFYNYNTNKLYTRVWASQRIAKANKNGMLGQVVNVAGMHSVRRTAVVEVFEQNQDLRVAQAFLGHKNILTTSNYLQDNKTTMQDKLRLALCE